MTAVGTSVTGQLTFAFLTVVPVGQRMIDRSHTQQFTGLSELFFLLVDLSLFRGFAVSVSHIDNNCCVRIFDIVDNLVKCLTRHTDNDCLRRVLQLKLILIGKVIRLVINEYGNLGNDTFKGVHQTETSPDHSH